VTRARPALPLLILVLLLPAAAAQAPTTRLELRAEPAGPWHGDGFLAASNETARWQVTATVTFSNTAVCAESTELVLELLDLQAVSATRTVEPARQEVSAPAGGGNLVRHANATFTVPPDADGGAPASLLLHGYVVGCPPPAGTAPRADANLTLAATTLFAPGLDVDHDNRSSAGWFNFSVRNTGNGDLRLGVDVRPHAGSPDQAVTAPSDLALARSEFTTFTVRLLERRAGTYDAVITGRFNGPEPDAHRQVTYTAQIQVPEPTVVRETKKAPGAEAASLATLAAAALLLGRRK
jgi:hypothetical protein